jgi:hypothetical protein
MTHHQNDGGKMKKEIEIAELRALLFWAAVGVSQSRGGSYQSVASNDDYGGTIERLAEEIRFRLPYKPRFKDDSASVPPIRRR